MKDSYIYNMKQQLIIIDEFDDLLARHPYDVQEDAIKGLWGFKGKKIIGLTASLSQGDLHLVRKMIANDE